MRIFDTFMFDGELTLLQHRLVELYDLVDRFVLVEARKTYRNRPKPLVFAEHRAQFRWAAPKIQTVALDTLGGTELQPRERAAIQRNSVLLALRDAAADDIVLLLDADEIPSRELLLHLRSHELILPSRLAMTRHYEFLDSLAPASPCCPRPGVGLREPGVLRPGPWNRLGATWFGNSGVAVRFCDLAGDPGRAITGRSAFNLRFGPDVTAVFANAGRHFTAVDPAARLEHKLGRAFHEEHATERGMSVPHLARCRRYGIHHRGWWYTEVPKGPLPDDLGRLATLYPSMLRTRLPPFPSRYLLRTWAQLRLWKRLPEWVVGAVDRHFLMLAPLIAPPLLLINTLRAFRVCAARLAARKTRDI